MRVLCGLTLSLWVACLTHPIADGTHCENLDAMNQAMTDLATAMQESSPSMAAPDCTDRAKKFAALAEQAAGRIKSSRSLASASSSTDTTTRRFAVVSFGLSLLALLSAPLVTIFLFRRYGLISWRRPAGSSPLTAFTKRGSHGLR